MMKLGLRFLNYENRFNYRIALEIGLIIGLIICCSALITGLSNQFSTLISSSSSGPSNYFISESGMSYNDSAIPLQIYNQINDTYINFKIPFSIKSVLLPGGTSQYLYYTSFNDLMNSKSNFNLIKGFLPNGSSQFLIGLGLANTLGIKDSFPQVYEVYFSNNSIFNLTITGVFLDSNPWYFSFLGELNDLYNPQSIISFITVQLKNKLNLVVFEDQLKSLALANHLPTNLNVIEIRQNDVLAYSFYYEITQLFDFLIFFLFILMALKLVHSSLTILHRLKNEYLINKILGMNTINIQNIFLINLTVTGNLGVIFGVFIGLVLPQFLMVLINPFFGTHQLYLVPQFSDIIFSFFISNVIFFLCSFFVFLLKIKDFKG